MIGKDVAEVLEYTNPTKAIRIHCDDEDKLMSKMDTSFGEKDTYLINESGLYSLILRSKIEKAKRFKRWVTSEVLPALRKHGMYVTDDLLKVFFYLFLGTVERTVILFNKPCFKAVSTIII